MLCKFLQQFSGQSIQLKAHLYSKHCLIVFCPIQWYLMIFIQLEPCAHCNPFYLAEPDSYWLPQCREQCTAGCALTRYHDHFYTVHCTAHINIDVNTMPCICTHQYLVFHRYCSVHTYNGSHWLLYWNLHNSALVDCTSRCVYQYSLHFFKILFCCIFSRVSQKYTFFEFHFVLWTTGAN